MTTDAAAPTPIKRLLVANRSEIAIRVFRAAAELGIQTIAIYAEEDKLSLHRFKADEAYLVGRGAAGELRLGPLEAYLSIPEVIRVARAAKVDAIHPGYGFLSESPEFAEACAANGIVFIGPKPETMRTLGNKVAARNLAVSVGVPVMPATGPLPDDDAEIKRLAAEVGYPVMLKASWGGGGRGMRPIDSEDKLLDAVLAGKREAKAAFGKDEVYLEKLVRRARHIEVQLLGDTHGNLVHLFERDCTIQRRNQKVIERAPAPFLDEETRASAVRRRARRSARRPIIVGAGTVEFLMDADTGAFYFIEVNPRIQVEHTVTEQVTGLDIVKAQIKILEGGRLGRLDETGIPPQDEIALNGHALQCRITTENPGQQFHSRLRPHHRLSRRLRLRHPRRRRHRLFGRGRHALLRPAAGEGDGLGAVAARGRRADGSRFARIPHPRRRHQPRLPRGGAQPSEIPAQRLYDALHRRDAGAVRRQEAPRPRDQAADLYRRRHRQRPSRDQGPGEAAGGRAQARAAGLFAGRGADAEGAKPALRQARAGKIRRLDARGEARPRHRHDDARRASVAARDAHAHLRHRRPPRAPMRWACRSCSRWNAGAARPSTSRCGF